MHLTFNKADRHKSRAPSPQRRTDRQTDRPTDRVAYRVACTRLKTASKAGKAEKTMYPVTSVTSVKKSAKNDDAYPYDSYGIYNPDVDVEETFFGPPHSTHAQESWFARTNSASITKTL